MQPSEQARNATERAYDGARRTAALSLACAAERPVPSRLKAAKRTPEQSEAQRIGAGVEADDTIPKQPMRAMRTKARDGFIKALRDAHRWLDELLVDPTQTIKSLAIREGKSERSIRMTLTLAFMSPALAEAAMEGRLPRGFCIKRLTDLPMLWSEQWRAIGLQAPAQVRAELR